MQLYNQAKFHIDSRMIRYRTRWIDLIEDFAGGDWMVMALDATEWATYEHAFAEHVLSRPTRRSAT